MGKSNLLVQVILLSAFYSILVCNESPQLLTFPQGSTIRAPTDRTFSLRCSGRDDGYGNFTQMTWRDPKGELLPEGLIMHKLLFVTRSSSSVRLMFPKPVPGYNGEYVCSALYVPGVEITRTPIPENSTTLQVSVSLEFFVVPKIIRFENVSAAEGKDVQFKCTADGNPTPNVTVREFDGQDLEGRQDVDVYVEPSMMGNRTTVLFKIRRITRADDGPYLCAAESNERLVKSIARLDVQFPPNLNGTAQRQMAKSWETFVNLTCIADANPPAILTWKSPDGRIIDSEDQYHFSYGHRNISKLLVMLNETTGDELNSIRRYSCIARNHVGEDVIDIDLVETRVPGQITQIIFDQVTETTLTFRFMGPIDDGGMLVSSYVMKYSTPGTHELTIEWPKGSVYILSNLKPGAHYTFNVAAKNAVGVGVWKKSSYIMPVANISEETTLITKNVNITDYPDRYEIKWKIHDHEGNIKRYFVVTYFNDGRIMVQQLDDSNKAFLPGDLRRVIGKEGGKYLTSREDGAGRFRNN